MPKKGEKMPRARCCGWVEDLPLVQKFMPQNQMNHGTIKLCIEEMEAIRLKDLVGLEQDACGQKMGLSRQTFQRVLKSGRTKVALALSEGQTILIEGGNYMIKNRVFQCLDCGNQWEVEPCTEGGKHGYEIECPKCKSMSKSKINVDGTVHQCGGGHHGAGGCCGH